MGNKNIITNLEELIIHCDYSATCTSDVFVTHLYAGGAIIAEEAMDMLIKDEADNAE